MTNFGPTGQLVYERTYSRTKPDGSKEQWPDTVRRVVDGNLALVDARHHETGEREKLIALMDEFKVIPAGRQLWATGVRGRQFLYNCFVSGWDDDPAEHFRFTFQRLMEGGGVGANYSNRLLSGYGRIEYSLDVHIVCDDTHPDYQKMKDAGLLSEAYVDDWDGCYQVEDSREGWAAALVDLIHTYYRDDVQYVNRVYDVSRVRPEGAKLKTFGGVASGPSPFAKMMHDVSDVLNGVRYLSGMTAMEIDHAIAQCVVAGGNRRSARMSIMHWDDPQIEEFIRSKTDTGKHWTTNISVEIDNEFTKEIDNGGQKARRVLNLIAAGMLENGEPGFWNSSLSNQGEPNPVVATNPCGEVPLEPWEACNLGHVNLAAFVDDDGEPQQGVLIEAHRLLTRFLIRATFGDRTDESQAVVMDRNRRIGLGHLGFAEMAHMMGYSYAESADSSEIEVLLSRMAYVVDKETDRYSFELRIPRPVKTRTVAPTGTIAKMPGTTEGIHPIFSRYFLRRIRFSTIDPDQFATATAYAAQGYNVVPDIYADNTMVVEIPTKDIVFDRVAKLYGEDRAAEIVQSPAELSLSDMLAVQSMYQLMWADNAVSFTANVDPGLYTVSGVVHALTQALPYIKGATVFPELSRELAPYERITKEEYESAAAKAIEDSVDEDCATNACPVR